MINLFVKYMFLEGEGGAVSTCKYGTHILSLYTRMHIHTHIYTHIHTRTHAYTHTYTHTYIYTHCDSHQAQQLLGDTGFSGLQDLQQQLLHAQVTTQQWQQQQQQPQLQQQQQPQMQQQATAAQLMGQHRHLPPAFYCPLSQTLMVDPVVAADGITYNNAAIQDW